MELLNHLVAARLMKDTQLFERVGRHDATTPRLAKPLDPTLPAADLAANMPEIAQPTAPARGR